MDELARVNPLMTEDDVALQVFCFLKTWYGNTDWFEPYEPLGFGTGFIPVFISEGVRDRLIPLMDRFSRGVRRKAVEEGLALNSEERQQKANLIAPLILGSILPANVKAEFRDVVVEKERRVTVYVDPKPKRSKVEPDCSDRPISFED